MIRRYTAEVTDPTTGEIFTVTAATGVELEVAIDSLFGNAASEEDKTPAAYPPWWAGATGAFDDEDTR